MGVLLSIKRGVLAKLARSVEPRMAQINLDEIFAAEAAGKAEKTKKKSILTG